MKERSLIEQRLTFEDDILPKENQALATGGYLQQPGGVPVVKDQTSTPKLRSIHQ